MGKHLQGALDALDSQMQAEMDALLAKFAALSKQLEGELADLLDKIGEAKKDDQAEANARAFRLKCAEARQARFEGVADLVKNTVLPSGNFCELWCVDE